MSLAFLCLTVRRFDFLTYGNPSRGFISLVSSGGDRGGASGVGGLFIGVCGGTAPVAGEFGLFIGGAGGGGAAVGAAMVAPDLSVFRPFCVPAAGEFIVLSAQTVDDDAGAGDEGDGVGGGDFGVVAVAVGVSMVSDRGGSGGGGVAPGESVGWAGDRDRGVFLDESLATDGVRVGADVDYPGRDGGWD